jgi:Na+-driven multidrug efflux pump
MTSQNLAKEKFLRIKKTTKIALGFALAISLVFMGVVLLFPQYIGSLSLKSEQSLQILTGYFQVVSLTYPAFAIIFCFHGVIRGAGDTLAILILTFVGLIVLRIPLANYLALEKGMGLTGIWDAVFISSFFGALLNYLYYKSNWWKRKSLSMAKVR